jgi:hypothetical protein
MDVAQGYGRVKTPTPRVLGLQDQCEETNGESVCYMHVRARACVL